MDKPKSTEWPSEDRIDAIGQNGPSGDHYEDEAFRECERRLREAELEADVSACTRCDELSAQLKTSRRDYEVMNKFREGAEAERNALAAHVERFNELYRRSTEEDAGWMTNSHVVKEYAAICRDTPETSLAKRGAENQAEALRLAHEKLSERKEWVAAHHLLQVASEINDKLRRQAGGDV